MNAFETAYAARLELAMRAGTVLRYLYEAVTFRLTSGPAAVRYTPDFLVFYADGTIGCIECKGSHQQRVVSPSIRNLRIAADRFPEYRWVLATAQSRRNGCITEWAERELNSEAAEAGPV